MSVCGNAVLCRSHRINTVLLALYGRRTKKRKTEKDETPGGRAFATLRRRDGRIHPSVLDALCSVELGDEMHFRGIPMRHLGFIRAHFWHRLYATCTPVTQQRRLQFSSDPTLDIGRGAKVCVLLGGRSVALFV